MVVRWSPAAMADLHRAWAFLAERNPRAGGEARDRILDEVVIARVWHGREQRS